MEEQTHAAVLQVCLLCLDTDSKMVSMSHYKLGQAYEHLTGYPLLNVPNLNHTLCVKCTQKLTEFEAFRDMSLRARGLMMELVEQHAVITIEHIRGLQEQKVTLARAPELLRICSRRKRECVGLGEARCCVAVRTKPSLHMAWTVDNADIASVVKSEDSAVSKVQDWKLLDSTLCRVLLTRISCAKISSLDILCSSTQVGGKGQTRCASLSADLAQTSGKDFTSDEQLQPVDETVTNDNEHIDMSSNNGEESITEEHKQSEKTDLEENNSLLSAASPRDRRRGQQQENNNNIIENKKTTQDANCYEPVSHNEALAKLSLTIDVKLNKHNIIKTVQNATHSKLIDTKIQSILKYSPEVIFTCDVCKSWFKSKILLVKHIMSHYKEKSLICEFCGYKCSTNSLLVRHMRTHSGEKPFLCKLCPYKCSRNDYLVGHMRLHSGEKPFSCKLCSYKCTSKNSLVKHMRTHTGQKPYKCKVCQYKCTVNSSLIRHMRTHSGEKPYSCTLCLYKCTGKSHLESHIKTHTGEKSYSCALCSNKFTQNSSLLRHMRTHTGDKPFSCMMCQYKCTQKSSLVRHMRTHTS